MTTESESTYRIARVPPSPIPSATKLAAITAVAERWAHQPNDYDEDTEQQIADGHYLLYILRGLDLSRCQLVTCKGHRCEYVWHHDCKLADHGHRDKLCPVYSTGAS
jgi:hypothetical protein